MDRQAAHTHMVNGLRRYRENAAMRGAAAFVLACSLAAGGCATKVVRTAGSIPPAAQINLSKLPRVWVAGFVARGSNEIDLNAETVLLLRQQLRMVSSAAVIDAEPLALSSERDFTEVKRWRELGEEHGNPLIVTGSVALLLAPPAIVQRGPRTAYIPTAGRTLAATVVLIDGRTGEVVRTEPLPSRVRYGIGRFSSGPWLFFELMRRSLLDWLAAIARAGSP